MQIKKHLYVWVLLCLALLWSSALAQPQISGPQSGTLGPGTYLVVGDIRVATGTTLTVAPGTTFLHNGHWYWWISGQLIAQGTATDSIKFLRQQPVPEHCWGGIRFQIGAAWGSEIDYCVIDYAVIPAGTPSSYLGGGLFSDGVPLAVQHSRISNCDAYWGGGGMYVRNTDGFLVANCLIVDNEATLGSNGGGIYFYNCIGAMIAHCIIARNAATGT